MKTFMLTPPFSDASWQRDGAIDADEGDAVQFPDSAWPIMSWSCRRVHMPGAECPEEPGAGVRLPAAESRKVVPAISPSSSAAASKPICTSSLDSQWGVEAPRCRPYRQLGRPHQIPDLRLLQFRFPHLSSLTYRRAREACSSAMRRRGPAGAVDDVAGGDGADGGDRDCCVSVCALGVCGDPRSVIAGVCGGVLDPELSAEEGECRTGHGSCGGGGRLMAASRAARPSVSRRASR